MGKGDYFLGLDLGTNSVGWAVTDDRYKLQRFNKKDMWGSRLFDEASTAQDTRTQRSARRRTERKKKRIQILQALFADEMSRIDPTFFMRLKESNFHLEDKQIKTKHVLFNDEHFMDKQYFDKYPTIYHLRFDLIRNDSCSDIRLLYLAIHHILKYRGHFLFEGQDFSMEDSFERIFIKLSDYLYDQFEFEIPRNRNSEIESILLDRDLKLKDKQKKLESACDPKEKQLKNILNIMIGGKKKLSDIFVDTDFDDAEIKDVDFKTAVFDDRRDDYERILNEKILLLDHLKAVYDWMILAQILKKRHYLSEAKMDDFQQHGNDLRDLKKLIKKYGGNKVYHNCFIDKNIKSNYTSYVGSSLSDGKQQAEKYCNQDDVNDFFKKALAELQVEEKDMELYRRIRERLDEKVALPKLRTSDNSVIPYQVHKMELDRILDNAAKYHNFLNDVDETGLSVVEKIKKIMTFRIPYYIGPLNTFHSKDNGGDGYAWMIKKKDASILPWNFEEVVDEEESAERFIRNMTNKCTYVLGADVIPKDSLLYEKYKVLNELNNLKIDGKPITINLKQKIFQNLFMKKKKITQKMLRNYLKLEGMDHTDNIIISGVDGDFTSMLTSYHTLKNILGDKINFEPTSSMAEHIILWKCLFDSGGKIVNKKIRDAYSEGLTNEQLKAISNKNFNGWGRFSKEFLCEIGGRSVETGEVFGSLIEALENTNDNLMELLSSKYTFKEELEKMNSTTEAIDNISYDTVMEDVYLSPAVKRTVWQAITICEEIRKIRKKAPKRIFVEMTRNPEYKKERKDSRRKDLIKLYKSCEKEVKDLLSKLESYDDHKLKSRKLYLYYTQKGKCMYSRDDIKLDELLNNSALYDIDHIYPRSMTKDDSLDNLVLVKKDINTKLSDDYPKPADIQNTMIGFWAQLKEQGFISAKKFYRLIRKEPLTPEDLAGFINRQLVETGQSTKATADILRKIYPDTEIIYTKAKVVSDFRHKFDLLKCRELNNYHHAHDAFLNIVAGNAYHTKFTANPYNYIKKEREKGVRRPYNLEKFFDNKVERNGYVAWDKDFHLPFVKKTLERPTVNITRMPTIQKGKLFDATLERKTKANKNLAPIKGSDKRYKDFSKYGGYTKLKGAYFFAVEHTLKKTRIKSLEQVYLIYAETIRTDADLEKYCVDVLKLIEPKIILSKIKMGSKLIWDGFPLYLQSRTGDRIRMAVAEEVIFSKKSSEIFRKVSRELRQLKNKNAVNGLDFELSDLNNLYDEYIELLKGTRYQNRPNNPLKLLEENRVIFFELELMNKIKTLTEIHKLFGRASLNGVDLTLVGGSKSTGVIDKRKNISGTTLVIVNQSASGLFENRKVLNQK